MPAFAFEVEHGVDHVLEHARPGDDTFLGHVADEYQDKAAPLGHPDQLLRGCANLTDRAGRAVQGVEVHRLDRIDDNQGRGVLAVERGDDVAHIARCSQQQGARGDAETLRAQANLIDGLLAGDVGGNRGLPGRLLAGRGDRCCRLEQQSRLADPGIAADQDRRTGYEPAAADAVELDNAGLATRWQYARPGQADKAERAAAAPVETPLDASARQLLARQFLDEAVPCAAAVAPPGPFGMEGPALLTNEASLPRHRFSSAALDKTLS